MLTRTNLPPVFVHWLNDRWKKKKPFRTDCSPVGFLLVLLSLCSEWIHQRQGLTGTPHSLKRQQSGQGGSGQVSTPTSKPPDGQQPQARPPSHHLTGWKEPHADGEPHRAELVISRDHAKKNPRCIYFHSNCSAKVRLLFAKKEQNLAFRREDSRKGLRVNTGGYSPSLFWCLAAMRPNVSLFTLNTFEVQSGSTQPRWHSAGIFAESFISTSTHVSSALCALNCRWTTKKKSIWERIERSQFNLWVQKCCCLRIYFFRFGINQVDSSVSYYSYCCVYFYSLSIVWKMMLWTNINTIKPWPKTFTLRVACEM